MARTEYYRDPDAPRANRIVVAAVAFVQDSDGRVLLIQRSDNDLWALPGGAQDVGETVSAAAERETLEETGYRVTVTDLIGVYSDPQHVIAYEDGEVRQQFALSFRADLVDGQLATSDETPNVAWVSRSDLDRYRIHPSIRLRIEHGFEHRDMPYLG